MVSLVRSSNIAALIPVSSAFSAALSGTSKAQPAITPLIKPVVGNTFQYIHRSEFKVRLTLASPILNG